MRRAKPSVPGLLRVVIADDHRLLPEAVRALLEPDADIEVAGVAYESDRILALVTELEPDLLLLDSHMSGLNVLGFVDRLRAAHPAVAVVLLTETPEPELTTAAFARGVKGVILKGSDPAALAPALRAAISGENARPEPPAVPRVGLARRHDKLGVASRLEALRALVDRAIFGNDYDWL